MLKYGKIKPSPVIYSDSAYCINTFTDWMYKWEKNNWQKANGSEPENLDLIQAYYNKEQEGYRVYFKKVKYWGFTKVFFYFH